MKTICLRTLSIYLLMLAGMLACKKENALVRQNNSLSVIPSANTLLAGGGEVAIPVSWYQLELKLIRESSGFTPAVAARAIAYTGITLHEAVVWGMRDVPTLSGQLNGLNSLPRPERWKRYNWAIAANSAMADIIKRLFPNASPANQQLITQLEIDNLEALSDSCAEDVKLRSVNFGRQISGSIYQWSAADGGKDGYLNNFPPDYVPPVGPGFWVPTPPQFQRAMLPFWGYNRTLLKPAASDSASIQPPAFSTDPASVFYQAANAVYVKGKTLTPEETLIARYWADGAGTFTPPGHLIGITAQLATEQHLSLNAAARLFAQVGIALNDAGIHCWKYKYHYNLLRPVTYTQRHIDSSWLPLIGTPPFPAYTSGHASFTAAGGHILAAFFGQQFAFTDQQKVAEGFQPRTFSSFNSMVDEAAVSRFYGGIHYAFDSEVGKLTGKSLAVRVLQLRY